MQDACGSTTIVLHRLRLRPKAQVRNSNQGFIQDFLLGGKYESIS